MDDLVTRLRDVCLFSKTDWQDDVALAREAADEIERLRAALNEIANGDGYYGAQALDYKNIARAALSGEK